MTPANDHLTDQILSTLVDDKATSDELRHAEAHLATCQFCAARLEELHALVRVLRGLPSLDPPRDFVLGPRLMLDPPNLVRLRRWYGAARAGAASLAATFVFLTASALYVDSHAGSSRPPSAPQLASAPATSQDAAPASRALAPAAAQGASQAAPAAPTRTRSASGEEVTDQVSAATSVRPLGSPAPSIGPIFAQPPQPIARDPVSNPNADPAAPLRTAAAIVGLLAVFGVGATLVVRQRLKGASISRTE